MLLYRTMLADVDGLPRCGGGEAELGVRVGRDVPEGDFVIPGSGMSTFTDPKYLPRPLRPKILGGMSVLPTFEIEDVRLAEFHLQKKGKHVQVEPFVSTSLKAFEQLLCGTRKQWHNWTQTSPSPP